MKIAAMFVEQNFPEGKEVSTIPRHENFPSRSRRFVPVVIERYKSNVPGLMEKLKLQVSSKMTVSQLVCLLRRRMQLRPSQGFHLLYSKGKMAVMMSQRLGRISSEYKDSSGVLSFTFAAQTTFGCPVPRIQPVKSKFPGFEPNPFGAPEPSHWYDEAIMLELMGAAEPPSPPAYDMNSLFMDFVLSLFPANHFAPPPPPTFSDEHFSSTPTDNYFSSHNSIFAFSPEPMEVSEEENPSPSSPPELLPLASLIQSLNHLVPFWHIHLLSPDPTSVQPAAEYVPLVNSLNQIIQSLQNHVPSEVYLSMTGGSPPQHYPVPYNYMTNFLADATSQAVSEVSDIQGALATQANHTALALDMANQVLSGLSDPSNVPVEEGEQGMVQLDALTQYFSQAAQFLQFQAGGGSIPNHGPLHSFPFGMAPFLVPYYNLPSSLYLTDSDSLSEEEFVL